MTHFLPNRARVAERLRHNGDVAGLVVALLFGAWLLFGAALTLLFGDVALRRKSAPILVRLAPRYHRGVADEAARWLRQQSQGEPSPGDE